VTRSERRWPAFGVGLFVLVCAASTVQAQPASPPFELKDGDRVVLLGGTFIERDQTYGYLETLLTARYPDRSITFRNLGWSGDTVWGEARSRFGPPTEGFAHLRQHVEALKPTVIFVNYGLNESYAGKAGLFRFEQRLNTLLGILDKTGARIVMITPRRLEKLPAPLPDPAAANERLGEYVALIKKTAERRMYRVVDLFDSWPDSDKGLRYTDNGIHFSDLGYGVAARLITDQLLGRERSDYSIKLDATGTALAGSTGKVTHVKQDDGVLSFRHTDESLLPGLIAVRSLEVKGLKPGRYEVSIDGQLVGSEVVKADHFSCVIETQFEFDQAKQLRAAINAKNELYFYRWRPQNETYLFGFRKHEQGNNAREIPLFDPLVAAKEAEIARLKVPVAHTYEITRKGDVP
jgi:lysophospholipase L1-like esterase